MKKTEKEKIVRSVQRTCKGPLSDQAAGMKEALIAGGDFSGAREADRIGRQGCGQDVNDLIVAHLDKPGQTLDVECPGCEREIAMTIPVFDDADREAYRAHRLGQLKPVEE